MSVAEKLKAIADNIRSKTGIGKALTLDDMAESIQIVYSTGKFEGETIGRQSAYDEFWDDFQQNGNRTMYNFSFGCGWNADNFKPKYQMKPKRAYMMFYNNEDDCLIIPDFVEFCDNLATEQGKTIVKNPEMFDENGHYQLLDFSQCTSAHGVLARLHTKHHGVLDFSKCTSMGQLFYSHNWAPSRTIQKIDKFISSEDTNFAATTFQHAVSLTDITMSGVVAKSIDFGACPLNKESIESVVRVLSDTVTGQTATFKKTAKEAAFTEQEWDVLITTKPNWTITLV